MKKNLLTATLLLCLGLLPTLAKNDDDDAKDKAKEKAKMEEKRKDETERAFKKLDTNKDTKLSADEFNAAKFNKGKTADDLKKALDEQDSDKDGSISATEFKLPPKEEKEKDKKEKKDK